MPMRPVMELRSWCYFIFPHFGVSVLCVLFNDLLNVSVTIS